jgi:hypothetical protein
LSTPGLRFTLRTEDLLTYLRLTYLLTPWRYSPRRTKDTFYFTFLKQIEGRQTYEITNLSVCVSLNKFELLYFHEIQQGGHAAKGGLDLQSSIFKHFKTAEVQTSELDAKPSAVSFGVSRESSVVKQCNNGIRGWKLCNSDT